MSINFPAPLNLYAPLSGAVFTGAIAAPTGAFGGATIGTNALAVAGTIAGSSTVTATKFIASVGQIATTGFTWGTDGNGFHQSGAGNTAFFIDSGSSAFGELGVRSGFSGLGLNSTSFVQWGGVGSTYTSFFGSPSAAKFQFGAADAAAPVAQTLSVQGVVAGTLNTAGQDFTIAMSQSTGTGQPGNLVIQGASLGSSGTTVNALATVATFYGYNSSFLGSGTPASGLDIAGYLTVASIAKGTLVKFGAIGDPEYAFQSSYMRVRPGGGFSWAPTNSSIHTATLDLLLSRRAAANINHGAADVDTGPVAQTLSVQSALAGGTSNVAGANFTITGSQGKGTGVGGDVAIQVAPAGTSGTAQNALVDGIRVKGTGSVVLGSAAIATNATDGFLYVVTSAGAPTGVPTVFTGRVALQYDTTNHKLWIYDGAWLQPKTPAGAAVVTWQ